MAPSSIKLYYFNATGRANQIRLALAAGGVQWEDAHPSGFPPSPEDKANWSALTNNNTTFAVPILTIDEGTDSQKVYLQSSAVLRKAGRLGDLKMTLKDDDADGDQAAYLTDRAIADADDLRSAGYKGFVIFGASKESATKFAKEVLPKHIDNLERQFVAAGGDFWGGSSTISIADATLYDAIVGFGTNLIDGAEGVENPCGPALTAWIKRVESNKRIKAYLEGDQFKNIAGKFNKSALGF
jgi:glutathione S-transferase